MSLWLEPAVFPVLLDSCVLYPYELRDLLLEVAHEHLYRVHWSPQILEDTVRNLLADARSTPEKASRFCAAMERAFPEAMVEPPSGLADQLGCDPGDRHVLAAAIAAKAELIVTLNASGMGLRFWCLNFGKRWMVAPTGMHRAGGGRWR